MYKKQTDADKLQAILAKLKGKEPEVVYPKVIYTETEITRARSVLDRILKQAPRDVSYISHPRKQIDEV